LTSHPEKALLPVKILQITRQFLPSTGGIEAVVDGLSRALQNHGHEVSIVTLKKIFATGEAAPDRSVVNGLPVSRIDHWGIRRYPIAPKVLSHVNGQDLLHVHAVDFFVDFLGWSQAFHKHPIVLSTHGGIFHTKWLSRLKSIYFRTVTRRSLRRVAAVLCVSPQDYQLFSKIVPEEKLHLVSNGAAIDGYLEMKKNITPGLILGIGRVAENKGIDRLLMALAQLRESHPHARLVWAGPDEAGRTETHYRLCAELDITKKVQFTGRIEDAALRNLLVRAHVFASASLYEGFGLSTIEAMSSGTVPVVTRVGVHSQIIEDGKSGFLVDGSPDAIAQGLRSALDLNPSALAEMGVQARRASAGCSWKETVRSYERIYESVLSN
jgi:alpha-1,3-mannosyltransferase